MDSQPAWDWSSVEPDAPPVPTHENKEHHEAHQSPEESSTTPENKEQHSSPPRPPEGRRRFYGPRTCRICLDTEEPRFPDESSSSFGIAATSSRPTYASDDPDLGRLLCPCKCKGSQKYVHEGCLNAWRLANPTEARNYWQCPTCKFTYQMRRLHWAAILSSKVAQVLLTLVVSVCAIYVLGWIADPILDIWFDPVGTISETVASVVRDVEAREPAYQVPPSTWDEHFLKGFLSLGIIGFFKTVFIMTPWDMLNLRGVGMMRGGRRGGRARMDNTYLMLVFVGAVTFLMGIWRMVRAVSTRVLKRMSDRVLDVGEDEDEEADGATESRKDL